MGDAADNDGAARDAVSGHYVSLLLRFRVTDDGTILRVTVEEVQTRARAVLDLSTFAAFLRAAFAASYTQSTSDSDSEVP